ncbi:MAG: hypothetical protein EHM33_04105 [Chloroflexi bacterium]|nr:MAG: hypothetical protein EHM33_04105 [Chloroflexota bacterium]
MGPLYRTLANYEPLIYIALAIGAMFAFRRMWRAWREWRDSVYGLEREFALRRLGQATAAAFLILALIFAEFFIATFIAPSLPASDILATPTLDLLLTPPGTLSPADATQAALSPVTQEVPSGMSGCIPDQIMILSPEPGEIISGTVGITGTANVPNFAFYKYEIARLGTQEWATISADRDPKQNEELGEWNTTSLTNGEYFLRLVITDNVGVALEPCVIAVRVANQ